VRTVKAGVDYAAVIFAVGFVLGSIRVTLVAPTIGALPATIAELPLMLLASWFVAGWLCERFTVSTNFAARLLMGAVGFALLMTLELLLGLAFGQPVGAQLRATATHAGAAGFLGQIAFGLIPALRLLVNPG